MDWVMSLEVARFLQVPVHELQNVPQIILDKAREIIEAKRKQT